MPKDGLGAGPETDEDEAGIGALFGRLIDDGKAYAQAEVDLVRARAEGQAGRAKLPAILGAGAIAFGFAAVIALVLTMVLALASLLGPLGGGLLATVIAIVIAGGLALAALKSWQAGA
ncbi:MAG: phage holin family protein [Sphingomonas bacterium]|nr:phage holin family protein [Sphingomonas bacterium]